MRSFRLGLYDPLDDSAPVQLVGEVFRDTQTDRHVVRLVLQKFRKWTAKHDDVLRCLGIFPVRRRKARKGDTG